jgi:hypothetical protein
MGLALLQVELIGPQFGSMPHFNRALSLSSPLPVHLAQSGQSVAAMWAPGFWMFV